MKTVQINRPVYNDQTIQTFVKPNNDLRLRWQYRMKHKWSRYCKKWSWTDQLRKWFPIATWLLQFDYRRHFLTEVLAGVTIAFINIPQGMAFATLIHLPAYYGLYVAFFPVIIYILMGSCHHQSWGGFGVTAIMTGDVVVKLVNSNLLEDTTDKECLMTTSMTTTSTMTTTSSPEPIGPYPVDVAITIALMAGIIQCVMGFLNMGFVSVYLSKSFIQALTTGAAFQVATSQVTRLLGVTFTRPSEPLAFFESWIGIFKSLPDINWATVILSIVGLVLLVTMTLVNRKWKRQLPVPIPMDMIVVIVLTLISHFLEVDDNYCVAVVGKVETGIPHLRLPSPSLFPDLLANSFAVALVTFAVDISLGKTIAERHDYKIDENQELLASGFANSISSFFLCYVSGPSLSRIWILEKAGGRSQITSAINCVVVLIMILALGRYFEPLPKAALAVVLIFSLKEMFYQLRHLPSLYQKSRWDFLVWVVTFSAVIILGVAEGLFLSLVFSFFVLVLRVQFPGYKLEGKINGSELFLDQESYKVDVSPKCIVFHMETSLCYLNAAKFKARLMDHLMSFRMQDLEKLDSNDQEELVTTTASHTAGDIGGEVNRNTDKEVETNGASISVKNSQLQPATEEGTPSQQGVGIRGRVVLINCSSFSFVDLDGAGVLAAVINECKMEDAKVLLAGCSESVRKILLASGHFDALTDIFYPSLVDAYTSQF
ncbi:prestin-like isoform X2 [Apostichopus japonicus]|uniref:prestin-like isoform X2 n=1 Tax=Stichopus japonicus TaxID=307972 RepID=UPI003AB2649D